MKKSFVSKILISSVVIFAFLSGSTIYSQKKSVKNLPKGSVKLEYNYPADKSFKYHADSKIIQDMDVNGQSMLVNVSSYMGCEVKSAGRLADKLKLNIKIDSLAQFIDSPQGSAGGPVNELKGKTFNIVISPAGKTEDLSEAAAIVYNVEGSGENTLAQEFLNYFPALPKGPVKTGDMWVTNDTIQSKSQSMSMWMPIKSENKYEGIEKIDGIDCARITATLSGSRKMTAQSQGMNINTTGTYTGTQLLLFAVKEGYFVKETVTTRMNGTIEIADQGMSFPVVMDVTSTNEIVK